MIRPGGPSDLDAAAALMLEPAGGLNSIAPDRPTALRMARSALAWPPALEGRWLVAEEDGGVVGLCVRFPGSDWPRLRVGVGMSMLWAGGAIGAARLLWLGRAQERLMPPLADDRLYVMSLSIAPSHRGRGIGTALLERVAAEGGRSGIRAVALDVDADNEGAIRFYERVGFAATDRRLAPPVRGVSQVTSIRMELALV